jgi:lipooligosaccharide transport system ATP-binding protein
VLARDLAKSYGSRRAVDGVSFAIRPGELFGFLGPNGAGKTTTMRMITGLAPRDAGELSVLGLDPERDARRLKRRIGVVAQDTTLDLELTVRENLLVFARYFDIPRREAQERADGLLGFVGLTARRDEAVERLSGGMRRRLQIARALINRPALVVLDEPTTGLDPQARHLVWQRLRELRAEGATLVLTTHYMDEAAQLCDRLVIMDDGVVVSEGSPGDLIRRHVGAAVLELGVAGQDVAGLLARLPGTALRGHQAEDGLLVLYTDDAEELRRALPAEAVPRAVRPATLEDVFLALTGRRLRDAG